MHIWKTTFSIAILSATLIMLSGCDPWYYSHSSFDSHGYCAEYAVDEYEICDLYCDYWGCWEDCYYTYDEYCIDYVVEDHHDDTNSNPGYAECSSDYDCRRGEECTSNGTCIERSEPSGDTGQLCDPCDKHTDCNGENSLCVVFEEGGSGYCGTNCQNDDDCPSDYECYKTESLSQCIPINRICSDTSDNNPIPVYDCAKDSECEANETCTNGSCILNEPECSDATDCNADMICIHGECVEDTAESCTYNEDCTDAGLCVDGRCRAYCSTDGDCVGDEICRGGACSPPPEPECTVGSDCSQDNAVCVNGQCRTGCSTNTDCDTGMTCTAGFCEFADVECQTSGDCGSDQVCLSGACFFSCRASCSCPEGLTCDTETGACMDSVAPETCEVDCDCPSGQICSSNVCTTQG